jgi:hypothetical protein
MAQSLKKRLDSSNKPKSRKTQMKFQNRMENNYAILNKLEL